ncbi:ArsR/SmtB family transcription factor [Corynebacterium mayonis]|uniref:ArsR/SmtB family transcription factor n=1 Tax=Corynebacterium mayonis TaxID=3062461 RepID=UPI003140C827
MTYSEDDIKRAASLASALDSPLRLHILVLLTSGNHVVHELVRKLGKSQPLISQHLRVLKSARLVDSSRRGREVEYTLASPRVQKAIGCLLELSAPDSFNGLSYHRVPGSNSAGATEAVAAVSPPEQIRPDNDPGLTPATPNPPLG